MTSDNTYSFLSVDVEALPDRAESNHFENLILGRYEGKNYGVPFYLELFKEYKIKGNFFIDLSGLLYGEKKNYIKLVNLILEEGHEVDLHLHFEWIARALKLERSGNVTPFYGDFLPRNLSDSIIEWACFQFEQIVQSSPKIFRPGGFRYSSNIIESLGSAGFIASSSFHTDRNEQSDLKLNNSNEIFRYQNNLIEIPFDIAPEPLSVNYSIFRGAFDRLSRKKIRTMNIVNHSWSFLNRVGNYHMGFNVEYEKKYRQFLECIISESTVLTYQDFLKNHLVEIKSLQIDIPFKSDALSISDDLRSCNICHLVSSKKIGGDRCPGCGSRTRQRALKKYFSDSGNFLDNTDVLACHANDCESSAFLKDVKRLVNFDIRPLAPFQMDIQDMSIIESESFDNFLAMHVLNHVKDDLAAIKEIYRVLKPNGVAIITLPILEEHIITDPKFDTYGRDAFDKYGIADYRKYSKSFLVERCRGLFDVEEHLCQDEFTGVVDSIFILRKQLSVN